MIMESDNSADRRVFARITKTIPIRFLPAGRSKESLGQIVDISANGIGVVSEERLYPKTSLELWLDLPDNRGPFYTRGRVVWADTSRQRVGIRLEKAELMGFSPVLWR